nr:ribonuclease H-like domain-containing protein [Tanacetum cinerariifolium]
MTGNKEMLDDFVQVKGGIVKFRGGDGRISGRGTIRTSKLDFENVYYVEELQHFNLFFVSQTLIAWCLLRNSHYLMKVRLCSEFLGNVISTPLAFQICNQNSLLLV